MSFTPPPAPPPASVPIPSRRLDSQEDFDAKTDAYLTWTEAYRNWAAGFVSWLPVFTGEVGQAQVAVDQAVEAAQYAAVAAAAGSEAALASANFKGLWQDLAGPLAKPASVKHKGRIWLLLSNLPNAAASEPGVSADWTSLDMGNVMQKVAASTAMVPGVTYVVMTPGIKLTAPATLLIGDPLRAQDVSGGGFLVDWGGHSVRSDPQTVPMAIPAYQGFDLIYTGSTLA